MPTLRLICLLSASLFFLSTSSCVDVIVTPINMSAHVAIRRDWARRPAGLSPGFSDVVKRMNSASCQDRLFVSWTAHVGWEVNPKNAEWGGTTRQIEHTVGHIAEYRIDATTGEATLISDKELWWCNETNTISVATDCSVVGLLCRSKQEADDVPGTIDYVTIKKKCRERPSIRRRVEYE